MQRLAPVLETGFEDSGDYSETSLGLLWDFFGTENLLVERRAHYLGSSPSRQRTSVPTIEGVGEFPGRTPKEVKWQWPLSASESWESDLLPRLRQLVPVHPELSR